MTAIISAVLAAVSVLVTLTSADVHPEGTVITTTVTDPDDTGGPLDLLRVRHRIKETADGATVRYRLWTQHGFGDRSLSRRHRHFVLELGTDGERGADRNITVHQQGGEPRADLVSNATREVLAPVHVRRVGPDTLVLRGPRDLIGARRYFWTTNFHRDGNRRCGREGGWPITCQDSVPDRGWLRMDRLGWPSAD